MADLTVTTASLAATSRGMRSLVFTSRDVGYFFNIGGGTDLDYVKTTDGGKTWGAAVDVFTGTVEAFDVWYDQWTPGNFGRDIHVFLIEGGAIDDVIYVRINTTNDTKVQVTAVALTTTVAGRGQFISGCRAKGGNLYLCYDIDAGAEVGFYRSLDNGATWGSRAAVVEATLDQGMLFPSNSADPQDIWILYDDDSATQLTVKTYDDSANTVGESSGLTFDNQATDATGQYGFSGAIRHQDGHLIFAFCNAFDAAGEDFLVYDWDGATLTALTALTTDIDDMYYPSVYLHEGQPDWIYVAYIGKSDGSETLLTTAAVYYALSKDRGLTWTKDIPYSTSSTDYRQTWAPLNGQRFMVCWMDVSAVDIINNHDNSKEFGFTTFNNYMFPSASGNVSAAVS